MEIKKAIYSYLSNTAALSAIVSDRIYPSLRPPSGGFPAKSIAYSRRSDTNIYSHDGNSRLYKPVFQFNCYAESDLKAEEIAIELRKAMEDFKGVYAGIKVHKAFYTGGTDRFADDSEIFIVVCEFEIQHY